MPAHIFMTHNFLSENDDVENDKVINDIKSCADNNQSVCEICTDTNDDMLSYGCPHYYCRICVETCLETDINEGKIDSFKCPAPECDISVSENFVKMIVSATIFNKYETLMLKKGVADMDDIVSICVYTYTVALVIQIFYWQGLLSICRMWCND